MENSGSHIERAQRTSKCSTDGESSADGFQRDIQLAESINNILRYTQQLLEMVVPDRSMLDVISNLKIDLTKRASPSKPRPDNVPAAVPKKLPEKIAQTAFEIYLPSKSTDAAALGERDEKATMTVSDTQPHLARGSTEVPSKMTSDTPMVPNFALPLALWKGPEHPVTKMMERCHAQSLERQRRGAAIEYWKQQGVKFHDWMITEEWISQFEACLRSGCERCVEEVIKASSREKTVVNAQPARKRHVKSCVSDQHREIKAQPNDTSLTAYERRTAKYSRMRPKSTFKPLHPAKAAWPLRPAPLELQFLGHEHLMPKPVLPVPTKKDWLIDLDSDTEDDTKLEERNGNTLEETVKPAKKEYLLSIENYQSLI